MNRETAVAIWYRRLDPGCFTTPRRTADADGSPSMETSAGEQVGADAPVYATNVADHWPALAGDRRGWSVEAAADRL
jgi:hypothetical protein